MKRERVPVIRQYREMADLHQPHPGCLIDEVAALVPAEHQSAWLKGVAWRPKVEGWSQNFDSAMSSLLSGVRPLLYGWPSSKIVEAAERHGLSILGLGWVDVAFLDRNRDLAALMAWGHGQPERVLHVVNGVALGYPLSSVETWILTGCPGPSLQEMLRDGKCD